MSSQSFTIKPFKRIRLWHVFAIFFVAALTRLLAKASSAHPIDTDFITNVLLTSSIYFFTYLYLCHQQNKTSDQHTLIITEDSLIFSDFNQQAAVSFEQISKVIIKKRLFGKNKDALHCLQIKHGPYIRFPEYQNNDELVALIKTRLENKVHHLRWFQLSGSPTSHTRLYGLSQFEDKTSQSASEA